ncbi:MAG: TerC/Alx family metal homeostasis membrane protein [Clostridiales Family XIII bacterium]|uniref:TerC/Alx family metal homeostasis membrane protein n=1 Tax=Hominibacterium faecale TaxID=2839743 RepID=A0A9J6QIR1_9FIRM|nr:MULTISPECIES: TerC/Alx family metal homeostasis membrane protein [Eubacteriales Family XIII. Incertae Sedis]MCU7376985.1 TerC/Alx family metal homeostasis membrane protein [Hominibacterium faecale]MDE8731775.1 TerC/Alx family metal homeostasis membrane protein [Eubacteriales bacterium DFI.9.88]MDY3010869.1 TerC/Alx family metal homeostasis membrane protein [Clostridiales Family XIII bacterium]
MRHILKSLKWVLFWMGLAILFNLGIWYFMGEQKALEFLGGYLIELSLSVDNLFVFITIFMSYGIKEHAQHRVLGYGIAGAVILRFIFIFFGVKIVNMFEWVLYIFGAVLIINGVKMFQKEKEKDPHDSPIVRAIAKVLPMTKEFSGEKFMVRENGKRLFTPLFAVLCLIECSDILFAIDSVPAVFSVSTDLLIVYTSNIFAILGLRQLYFVLEHLHERFAYVKYGVATILMFTGVKLAGLMFGLHISIPVSIGVIAGVLVISIIVSILVSKGKKQEKGKGKKNEDFEAGSPD